MEIRFEAAEAGRDQELRSLHHWFRDDRSLRGAVRVEPVRGERPGRMAPVLEAVSAALSSAAALHELARSYLAWLRRHGQSRQEAPVTVVVLGTGTQTAEAEAVLRELGVLPSAADGARASAPDPGDGAGRSPETTETTEATEATEPAETAESPNSPAPAESPRPAESTTGGEETR